MSLAHCKINDLVTVDIEGEFTSQLKTELRPYVIGLVKEHNPRAVVLNFERVGFVDSQMIGTVVAIYKHLATQQCKFALCRLSKATRDVFQLAKLDKVIPLYATEEEALEALQ